MDADTLSETLEAVSSPKLAKSRGKEIRTLKGVRGVPDGELARICDAAWREYRPTLEHEDDLAELFRTAWEDGVLAIALLSAMGPDQPSEVYEIGLEWLTRTDDGATADALGWLVLGPCGLAAGIDIRELIRETRNAGHPAVRRAAVMAGMALTGLPIEGPAAAALRARLDDKRVAFVEQPDSDAIGAVASAFVRDEDPMVRKAMRRLLRAWGTADPAAQVHWGRHFPGGLPKMLRAEIDKADKRLARQLKAAE